MRTVLEMMREFSIINLSFDGLTVQRTPYPEPEKSQLPSQNPDFVKELEKMPPDTQDKLLMLRRTRGSV